jgi:hypothetical protein
MMRVVKLSVLVSVLAAAPLSVHAEPPRQYYSDWRKHAEKPYFYRWYYFKPSATDREYHYHYGIYYPSRGKRVYLYNPETKRFWGYYDMEVKGYSLLPTEMRRQRIDDIPAESFPKPGKMPPIPGAEDGAAMLEPPNDLPKLDDLPD